MGIKLKQRKLLLMLAIFNTAYLMIIKPIELMMIFLVLAQNFNLIKIKMCPSLKMDDMCFTQQTTMFSLVMLIRI
jgi:hypothetical protein